MLDDLEGLSEDDQLRRLIEEYYAFVAKHPDSVKLVLGVKFDTVHWEISSVDRLTGTVEPAKEYLWEAKAGGVRS